MTLKGTALVAYPGHIVLLNLSLRRREGLLDDEQMLVC